MSLASAPKHGIFATLLVCVCWCSVRGYAQSPAESSRSAVLLGKIDPELLARIRGQTADLDWALVVEETEETPSMNLAQSVGERRGVSVAIWFEVSDQGGWVVNVAEIGARRLFSRRIEPPGEEETLPSSTLAEAAALVVRSSLTALAAGDEIGEVVPPEPEPTPTQAVPPLKDSRKPPETPVTPGPGGVRWQLSAGWQLGLVPIRDDRPSVQHGPAFRGALELGRVELALLIWGAPWPAELEDEDEELTVRAHRAQALAMVGYALLPGDELRPIAAAGIGALAFYRSTEVHKENLWEETPPTFKPALVLRLEQRLQWFPKWTGHLLGLELSVAADIVPAPPTFATREAESGEEATVNDRYTLWPVHIAGGIGLVFRMAGG